MEVRYYGDKISKHIAKTPEGFLICQDVPISRTGFQSYLASEIMENCADKHKIIHVYRPASEVFNEKSLASFEGKPVCNEHPQEDITPENYHKFACGHVQNVHMGEGEDANKVLADLYITDPVLIQLIKDGKREISCGYYAEEKRDRDGRLCQTKIRGNHVAVVGSGRAGKSVCIRDHKPRLDFNSSLSDLSSGRHGLLRLENRLLSRLEPTMESIMGRYYYDDDDELLESVEDDDLEEFEDDLEEDFDDDGYGEEFDDDDEEDFEDDDEEDFEDDDEEDIEDDDEEEFEDAFYNDLDIMGAVKGAANSVKGSGRAFEKGFKQANLSKGAKVKSRAAGKYAGEFGSPKHAMARGASGKKNLNVTWGGKGKQVHSRAAGSFDNHGTATSLGRKAGHAKNTIKKAPGRAGSAIAEKASSAKNTVGNWISENPGRAIGIGTGAGVVGGFAAGRASKDSWYPYYDDDYYFLDDDLVGTDEIGVEDDDDFEEGDTIEEKADALLEDARRVLKKAKKKLRRSGKKKKDALILNDDDDELEEDGCYGDDDDDDLSESDEIDVEKTQALRNIAEASRGISDPHERKNVQDAIYSALCGRSQMSDVMSITSRNRMMRNDSLFGNGTSMSVAGQQAIYDSFNPHKN